MAKIGKTRLCGYAVTLTTMLLICFNAFRFNPARNELYTSPTFASYLIQRYFSFIYRPPIDIFADRYGHGASSGGGPINLVLGPNCRRFAMKSVEKLTSPAAIAADYCSLNIDKAKLADFARTNRTDQDGRWIYGELTDKELEAIR
jgi:hypothetical protein